MWNVESGARGSIQLERYIDSALHVNSPIACSAIIDDRIPFPVSGSPTPPLNCLLRTLIFSTVEKDRKKKENQVLKEEGIDLQQAIV